MAEPKMNACCCRAMSIQMFSDMADIAEEVSRIYLRPLLAGKDAGPRAVDLIRTVQMLVELPAEWEDWPEDAKLAYPKANWEGTKALYGDGNGHGPLFATCKFVDRETGACMIYDRRPGMCSRYANQPEEATNPGGECQWEHCAFHHEGKCRPNHEVLCGR